MRGPAPSRLRAWLQLIRPPNLFTVPGDPLAGFFLASALGPGDAPLGNAVFPVLAALFLYMGGLIGNDRADYQEDQRDRPDRPLPSGRITRAAAFGASACCAVVGLLFALGAGFATWWMACLVQSAILIYNGGLKHRPIPGALAMGACRGFSFLLGAAAALPRASAGIPLAIAAAGVTLYIAGVTWIADRETVEERMGFRRWLPLVSLLLTFPLVGALSGLAGPPFLVLGGLASGWACHQGGRLKGIPPRAVLGAAIGGLIRGLLLIQAAFATLGGTPGLAAAAVLLALWPASAAVAKRFYAT